MCAGSLGVPVRARRRGALRGYAPEMAQDALGGALLWIVPESRRRSLAERLLVAGAGGGAVGVLAMRRQPAEGMARSGHRW